jgi:hypothetical protein
MGSSTTLVFGGIPTDMDVKKIREAFPDDELQEGQVIPYATISDIIGNAKDANRFRSVTNRWRKLVEKDSQKFIGTEPGVGFKVLKDGEKLELSGSKLRSAVKSVRRSYVVAGHVDTKRLDEEERGRYDMLCSRHAKLLAAAQVRGQKEEDLPSITDGTGNPAG